MTIHDDDVRKALTDSGWYEGRKTDIADYLEWYKKFGLEAPEVVKDFLTSFGCMRLVIPSYRYRYCNELRGKTPQKDSDANKVLLTDPINCFRYLTTEFDFKDFKEYMGDLAAYYKVKAVYPIGSVEDDAEEFYLGENGELIFTFGDLTKKYGDSFESGIRSILTEFGEDMVYFSPD